MKYEVRPSVLILSTTPPFPRDYGNRNRVYQTTSFFKELGYEVYFLLYPFDSDWEKNIPTYYEMLAADFSYFSVIPNSRPLHRNAISYHHEIDEWWDDTIGLKIQWLMARKKFDVIFVNYTFFSKALTYAPNHTLKVLETHDLFSGRREVFEKYGVPPEFFYTNSAQEKIAFDRSDCVIAIKRAEDDFISSITETNVVTIPYWDDSVSEAVQARAFNGPFSHDRPLRLGFIGARNSVNSVNMNRFLARLARYTALYNVPVQVVVAGNVANELDKSYDFLVKLGYIDEIEDFYNSVDAIVAPLEFSTGIKIKVGEALARHLPVIATSNATDGFRTFHYTQTHSTVSDLCSSIVGIAYGEIDFSDLRAAARQAALAAKRAQTRGFRDFEKWVHSSLKKLVFITNRPFWYRSCYVDEFASQTIEYMSQIGPTIVIYLGTDRPVEKRVHGNFDLLQLDEDINALRNLSTKLNARFSLAAGCTLLLGKLKYADVYNEFECPMYEFTLANEESDLGIYIAKMDTHEVYIDALRYHPIGFPNNKDSKHVSVFFDTGDDWVELVRATVGTIAKELGYVLSEFPIPDYPAYNTALFQSCSACGDNKPIVIRKSGYTSGFIDSVRRFRALKVLLVTPEFIIPEARDQNGKPSVIASLRQFISDSDAHSNEFSDGGWSEFWEIFSTFLKTQPAGLNVRADFC